MTKINLIKMDPAQLHKEILEFGPVSCMECEFEGDIPVKYFLVGTNIETEAQYNDLQKQVGNELGHRSFTEMGHNDGLLISVCRCPRCGSEDIFQDV